MKFIELVVFLLFILISCNDGEELKEENFKKYSLITCGDNKVEEIEYDLSENNNIKTLWSWNAKDATDLPVGFHEYMNTTDECKPVDNNTKILITSSGGGVVLVDKKTKKSLFYAHVPNAHSAELLPNNRIAVVLSIATGGNSIKIFDLDKSDTAIFKDSLYSGHGVVWLPQRERLFVLGYSELRAYSLNDWDTSKPKLHLEKTWRIPDIDGHDLISVSNDRLILSTKSSVRNFNIPNESFSYFTPLKWVKHVKSINYDETTQRLVYTKGEENWWTHNIYGENPDVIITIPTRKIYKVRTFSE